MSKYWWLALIAACGGIVGGAILQQSKGCIASCDHSEHHKSGCQHTVGQPVDHSGHEHGTAEGWAKADHGHPSEVGHNHEAHNHEGHNH